VKAIVFIPAFFCLIGERQAVAEKEQYTNRLINEKSPYLLQHAHNPMDWYPWGNEAFEKAKKEDKSIFLSIGYSTCHYFQSAFDSRFGGFGPAPKFPQGSALSFLLRYWRHYQGSKALKMVEKTLDEMAKGGLYDQLGGGFHRYSTDQKWLLPYFEKMLYDEAILSRAYLEAYQATGKEEYERLAREIFEYVLRDMRHPEGGFYCGQDADSLDPEDPEKKKEGAFYLWRKEEIINLLGKETAEIFSYYFGVEPQGNAPSGQDNEFKGKNILHVVHSFEETSSVLINHLKR
jgi:uncharacterized protein YyaL (SSP411 family)